MVEREYIHTRDGGRERERDSKRRRGEGRDRNVGIILCSVLKSYENTMCGIMCGSIDKNTEYILSMVAVLRV